MNEMQARVEALRMAVELTQMVAPLAGIDNAVSGVALENVIPAADVLYAWITQGDAPAERPPFNLSDIRLSTEDMPGNYPTQAYPYIRESRIR